VTDSLPLDLMQALEMFALERMPDYTYTPVTPPPAWFRHILPLTEATGPLTLGAILPYLERFLSEAEPFWREGTRRSLVSGTFAAPGGAEDVLLRACALNLGPRSLLVLERLRGQEDLRDILQKARENKLELEQVIKRIESLRASVASLSKLTHELGQTGLTSAQRELVDGIVTAAGRVDAVVSEVLPQKRRG
jgi:hypothetical protein